MKNEGRYGNRSQSMIANQGMGEPCQVDQQDTRGGYPGADDPSRVFDSYNGAAIPTLRIRSMPARTTIRAFTELRDRPVEQKIDAVCGLYPEYMWEESLSPLNNWLSAAALEQGCGTDDVIEMAKIQARQAGGHNMRAWLQMLKEAK